MGTPASLMSSIIVLLCRPDLKVGTAGTELGNLNAMGVIKSPGSRGQGAGLNRQRQGRHGYHNRQQNEKHQSEH